MKRMLMLAGLCLFLTAALLQGMEAPEPETVIGPAAPCSPDGLSISDAVFSDPARPVCVRNGQPFALMLRSNPTTGYMWELAEPLSGRIVRFVGREYQAEKTDRVGAGGKEIWTFRAVGTGETRIRLKYVRSWEKETAPAETAAFRVFSGGDGKEKGIRH